MVSVYWSEAVNGLLEKNWYLYTGAKIYRYTEAKLLTVYWRKIGIGILEQNSTYIDLSRFMAV